MTRLVRDSKPIITLDKHTYTALLALSRRSGLSPDSLINLWIAAHELKLVDNPAPNAGEP